MEFRMMIGGVVQSFPTTTEPKDTTAYQLNSPEVLVSAAWGTAIEQGRWPREVRPSTRNRKHVLLRTALTCWVSRPKSSAGIAEFEVP
jgi:hypothetical protein